MRAFYIIIINSHQIIRQINYYSLAFCLDVVWINILQVVRFVMKGSGVEHEEQSAAEQKIRIWVPHYFCLRWIAKYIDRQTEKQTGRQTDAHRPRQTRKDRQEWQTGEQRDVQQKIVTLLSSKDFIPWQIVSPAKQNFMGEKSTGSNIHLLIEVKEQTKGPLCKHIQLPECQTIWHPVSPVSDWKKTELYWSRMDAELLMPVLVSSMPMPSYGVP
jgi:hypothetical protein